MQAFHLDTVDSTNDHAKGLIAGGEIQGDAYVTAREQTAGKGSRGRSWLSPRDGGIYLTVVHMPAQPVAGPQNSRAPEPAKATGAAKVSGGPAIDITTVTLAAGVACALALAETTGVDVQLKPVNDLYSRNRKLGGILTEAMFEGGFLKAVLIGVGLNVRPAERLVPEVEVQPICLDELTTNPIADDRVLRLTAAMVRGVGEWTRIALSGDTNRVRGTWERFRLRGTRYPTEPPGVSSAPFGADT